MTLQDIKKFKERVDRLLGQRRLRQAAKEMAETARREQAWSVADKLEKTEQNYAYMLRYMADGAADPERDKVYDGIVNDLYGALDDLSMQMEKADNPSLYYSTLRLRGLRGAQMEIPTLLSQYAKASSEGSIFEMLSTGGSVDEKTKRQHAERLLSDLFVSIWATPNLSNADYDTLSAALSGGEISPNAKTNIVWALTMGLMAKYDKKRMLLLITTYMSDIDMRVTSAALIGMLLGLWMYRDRPLAPKVAAALDSAKEKEGWLSDLRLAFVEMIRARDTERINRKIRDEVIPDMMNLRPQIMDKFKGLSSEKQDLASLQENPEWQDLLDKNGISDKLKELTEIQMEGGDVMMSTFAHLKQFPFFNEIGNWFLPYDSSHTAVEEEAASLGVVSDMIEKAKFFCDGDKYSFVLALKMVPQSQRQMMTSQFMAQSDSIYDAMRENAAASRPEARRKEVNLQMQNLYRFYKLFRRKDEFFDPFQSGINLIAVPALGAEFVDLDLLQVVAEFYFKLKYWDDALGVFKHMEDIVPGDSQRYQKMGYCSEKLGRTEEAVEYYLRAELLDADSRWTHRRLGACYRQLGNKEKAIECYSRLAEQDPSDLQAALLLGYAYIENDDLQKAIKQFYKVEFLDEKSTKAWRALAWTLFQTGDFGGARKYYGKILQNSPNAADYLNMGHVALAAGDTRSAINHYGLYLQNVSAGANAETLQKAIEDDSEALKKAGVDTATLPLVIDAVCYNLDFN
ncbi:MAG: tetratricopeptide repeat protein [Clostridium sp.]|nr:tetratricopeptide repeat protein [Clostridium sp.]